ncbi:hypothetical protein J1605_020864 [Eschrichtius robustus]|uniref:Grh/CP2 DB domain-containing protein n=1 Tax=Eschrichtius robustus TaxID=9764 RepID=A0AB34HG33_ESCRO|nr:hypothetical protein J1605_020864 [Eschrichtius robustus]
MQHHIRVALPLCLLSPEEEPETAGIQEQSWEGTTEAEERQTKQEVTDTKRALEPWPLPPHHKAGRKQLWLQPLRGLRCPCVRRLEPASRPSSGWPEHCSALLLQGRDKRQVVPTERGGEKVRKRCGNAGDVLALPIFKQEESSLPPDNENKILPFQYVLCAATSPAVKPHDETLTYLNQGQSYEIRMLNNRKLGELPEINGKLVKSIFRVMFHDRQLQYTEHQQLEGWRWNRHGDRILDIDIPMSVGIIDPRANPNQLNTVEFLWDPAKRTSVFIQVHCISTEFTMRKHGGEKGVPFRVQISTFKENENGEYTEHLHSASCQIKVLKPKGADRKQKTDREKMEKRTPHEKEKYQPSHETTILTECSPWPEITYVNNSPSPGFSSSHSSLSLGEGNGSPNHQPEPPPPVTDNLLPTTTPQEAQ